MKYPHFPNLKSGAWSDRWPSVSLWGLDVDSGTELVGCDPPALFMSPPSEYKPVRGRDCFCLTQTIPHLTPCLVPYSTQ
jgi:hypothetical protein